MSEPTQQMLDLFDEYHALAYNPANTNQQYRARHFFAALDKLLTPIVDCPACGYPKIGKMIDTFQRLKGKVV